jgi:uncharacterized damage-inducible protein DinB
MAETIGFNDLLLDAFGRIRDLVHHAVDGLSAEQLERRLDPDANSIAWLVWHLTRVQDDHIAAIAGREQTWIGDGWYERFGLPFEATAHGYGHQSEEVAAVRGVAAELLTGYHDAVYEQTIVWVKTIREHDLARIVDASWAPPVTLAVRLVSVISDDLQHVGQAEFVRGIVTR